MALRSRATQARAERAQAASEDAPATTGGSLAERRRRAVQPRGGTAEPAPAPAPDKTSAPTNAPVEEPAQQPDPAAEAGWETEPTPKRARKPRSDKGTKRAAPPDPESGDPAEWTAAQIRARMKEVEALHKELTKSFEIDKKALSDEYAQLAVQLLEA